MKLIKILRTDKWITSGGFKTSSQVGLFECPHCKTHIEKRKQAGIIAKSCGNQECRRATFTPNPDCKGNTKKDRIQDIPYYTVLKEKYRIMKQKYSICDEWATFQAFAKDMAESYANERNDGTKIALVVNGNLASKDTTSWKAIGKLTKFSKSIHPDFKYIYIVETSKYYKIGITNNIQDRISTISTCNPFDVNLIHAKEVLNAGMAESVLHEKYSDCNIKGEWFNLTQDKLNEAIKYIESLNK